MITAVCGKQERDKHRSCIPDCRKLEKDDYCTRISRINLTCNVSVNFNAYNATRHGTPT